MELSTNLYALCALAAIALIAGGCLWLKHHLKRSYRCA